MLFLSKFSSFSIAHESSLALVVKVKLFSLTPHDTFNVLFVSLDTVLNELVNFPSLTLDSAANNYNKM